MENTQCPTEEPRRFLETEPYLYSKHYAAKYGCDLAIPSWLALGSLVCYTRLVEEFALQKGSPVKILCASDITKNLNDPDDPGEDWNTIIWENNPYVEEMIDANQLDPAIMDAINPEFDNFCQSRHEITNLCAPYNLRPRQLRGSLFLSFEEMQWGLRSLSHLKRPVICLCPYGRSASSSESPWYLDKWLLLIETLKEQVSFFQIGHENFQQKPLSVFSTKTTVRQMMALIWASDIYIGFDTGPSHIATALEKPSIVLWDAVRKAPLEEQKQAGFSIAHMQRWAYPQNKNLVILGEKNHEVLSDCIEFVWDFLNSFQRTPFKDLSTT
ncbi:MAG: glycosyltransferase family 9 protein [Okeania sp. SIO3B5]|uniref:glycosyltransferase family 9 protein n=1 Tax=Okeania sp. SIO3B5 TaxID=2607811 RepID=UPI00140107B7|nr:glycosyltransferase family 9 protein [Okeania sp. SIO3B5]NEO53793.1 glycosyltransferase family 9 protein [Okeania sp. SIO3B5]